METPRRRTALETRTNRAGGAEKPHKPQVAAQQPASSQRPRRGREAADAPKAARSAQCVRRERGLATWMNFVFAPGGSASDTIGCIGPSLSLHAVERQRQETLLRARMAMLLRGPELGPLLFKVSQQVEDNFLRVRPPLNLTADVGLRDGLLSLLGCYSPVWLRLGLEAVTLESAPAPHEGESEALVLRRFADHRVLQAPAVLALGLSRSRSLSRSLTLTSPLTRSRSRSSALTPSLSRTRSLARPPRCSSLRPTAGTPRRSRGGRTRAHSTPRTSSSSSACCAPCCCSTRPRRRASCRATATSTPADLHVNPSTPTPPPLYPYPYPSSGAPRAERPVPLQPVLPHQVDRHDGRRVLPWVPLGSRRQPHQG